MVNKKGLSDIVATVLIVLLALAAIAIIWAFLQPTITRGGCQVDMRTKCTMTELQPLNCKHGSNSTTAYETVTYQLTKGTANSAVVIAEYADGSTKTSRDSSPPTQAYQSKNAPEIVTGAVGSQNATRAKVAAVLNDAKCGETVCDPSTVVMDCSS